MTTAFSAAALRNDALAQCGRYWPVGSEPVAALPMPAPAALPQEVLPPRLVMVRLPEFAEDVGVAGALAVPQHYCPASGRWTDVDWLCVMGWFLHNLAERAHEDAHGPIHSYSFRLHGWDERIWKHAWVNRAALFLRRWAAETAGRPEEELLGPMPAAEIRLTHDVDAIRKTFAIRGKQSAFLLFNAARRALHGRRREALSCLRKALRFFFTPGDDWGFERIARLDEAHGLTATFLFAGCPAPPPWKDFRRWLIDPQYDVAALAGRIAALRHAGHRVGLHPSVAAWRDADRLRATAERVAAAAGGPITVCRQHWLMFSFARTWAAQQQAGITEDCTLGFNDRSGFRNGAALAFTPAGSFGSYRAWPLALMDSHLHDYATCPEAAQKTTLHILKELWATGGQATILWHPHTISNDYGWQTTYNFLLNRLQ